MCKYSPRFDGSCVKYYDPIEDWYYEINCTHCKGHMNAHIARAQIHHIEFICDKETVVEPLMRVCYRYRNWYGDNNEYIFISEENSYYDFMKLCMDSNEIHHPVVYKATAMYEGLSKDGNPNWIILEDIKKIKNLHPWNNQHPCEYRGLSLCEGCGICKEDNNPFKDVIFEEKDLDKWIQINLDHLSRFKNEIQIQIPKICIKMFPPIHYKTKLEKLFE